MSEIPATNFPQKFTSAEEQHANELVNTAIDEAQVSFPILLSLFLHLILM